MFGYEYGVTDIDKYEKIEKDIYEKYKMWDIGTNKIMAWYMYIYIYIILIF